MAVDPITAKLLARLAVQTVTDEQARKRLLIIILAPVISLLSCLIGFYPVPAYQPDFHV